MGESSDPTRPPESGQITCYGHRTNHVLPTPGPGAATQWLDAAPLPAPMQPTAAARSRLIRGSDASSFGSAETDGSLLSVRDGEVPLAVVNLQVLSLDLELDRNPASVEPLVPGGVSEVVLVAQIVGDLLIDRFQIARLAR